LKLAQERVNALATALERQERMESEHRMAEVAASLPDGFIDTSMLDGVALEQGMSPYRSKPIRETVNQIGHSRGYGETHAPRILPPPPPPPPPSEVKPSPPLVLMPCTGAAKAWCAQRAGSLTSDLLRRHSSGLKAYCEMRGSDMVDESKSRATYIIRDRVSSAVEWLVPTVVSHASQRTSEFVWDMTMRVTAKVLAPVLRQERSLALKYGKAAVPIQRAYKARYARRELARRRRKRAMERDASVTLQRYMRGGFVRWEKRRRREAEEKRREGACLEIQRVIRGSYGRHYVNDR